MNKARKKPVPLAVWSGYTGKVRLLLPKHMAADFKEVLLDASLLPNVRLTTPAGAAQVAAKQLATEMLKRRPVVLSHAFETELRMTVPHSEALTLLAWLLSSNRTDDAAAPLRLLIDALYQLLS